MRPLAVCALTALLCLPTCPLFGQAATGQAVVAQAAALEALRMQPGEQVLPGDAAWPLGERLEFGARVSRSACSTIDNATDAGAPCFRVDIAPLPGPGPGQTGPRACLGLASALRLDLYKTRAVEFRIKASAPVAGILVITSSNTQDRASRDRVFGSFVIGTQWKTLRLPYGALAQLPGWAEESRRLGLRPGDNVLRPDSVEDLCIGVEAQRLPPGEPISLWIDSLRFVR
ncbi:MAG: hypothetical protein AB7E46_03955 [Desulfovibrio sp.]